jgi:hypothetical protein
MSFSRDLYPLVKIFQSKTWILATRFTSHFTKRQIKNSIHFDERFCVLAHLSEEIERNDIISFHGDDIEDASRGVNLSFHSHESSVKKMKMNNSALSNIIFLRRL